MADFAEKIIALTGFNAYGSDNIVNDETGQELATAWLTEGAKEVGKNLPRHYKMYSSTRTTLNNTSPTLDLDSIPGKILQVLRVTADSGGYQKDCRQIAPEKADLANDSTDMMHYATATDPVWWTASNSSGNPTLFILPTPTANQPAYVHYVTYPSVAYNATSITNFPDDAEHAVVLYAAMRALEYTMLQEEDQEVYAPQLAAIKESYQQAVAAISGGGPTEKPGR